MALPNASTIALVGTNQAEPRAVELSAGSLTAEFEDGGLRYIRYGEQEVIHAISFLARDENWGTHALNLDNVDVRQKKESFEVQFRGSCGPTGAELRFTALIIGRANGQLSFTAQATLDDDLLTNRTGFVVLHPLAVSGKPVIVETVDGQSVATHFPQQIDPLQPFRNIRALMTQHNPSLSAEVRMEGDTFEMEDQRNWSDASFKTYVRPLALPWPYLLAKGLRFEQSVTITVQASAPAARNGVNASLHAPKPLRITPDTNSCRDMPEIGLGIRAEHLTEAQSSIDALRVLKPGYFVAHLDLRHADPEQAIAGFAQLADKSGVPYVLEVVLTGQADPGRELTQVAAAARPHTAPRALQVSPAPDLKAVLPGSPWPPCPSFDEIFAAARTAFPDVVLGGGSFAYFTELNRKRPPTRLLDYITFTTCPIVHAPDDRSVMETLATIPFIASSARALFEPTPYRVGPSTIAARDNPYGAATLPNQDGPLGTRICLTDNDPRQRSLFGAAWNLGYFARFAAGGATHIALSELTGSRGMLNGTQPTAWFHLFAALASWRGSSISQPIVEPSDTSFVAFAAKRDNGAVLWLANLATRQRAIEIDFPLHNAAIARWNVGADFAATPAHKPLADGPLTLGPYETVEIRYAT